MSAIIQKYIFLFIKPIYLLEYSRRYARNIHVMGIISKMNSMGFPGEKINELLKKHKENTRLTGSFLLHYLTRPDDWNPGDIDIFATGDFCVELSDIMKGYELGKMHGHSNLDVPDHYVENELGHTFSIKKWMSQSGCKLQVITVDYTWIAGNIYGSNELTNIDNIIKLTFDLEIIKSWYDGERLFVPSTTYMSIITKCDRIPDVYLNIHKLNKVLSRVEKYAARGFSITLPVTVCIEVIYDRQYFYHDKYDFWKSNSFGAFYRLKT